MTTTPNPIVPGPDGEPVRMDRHMTDAEVATARGDYDDVAEATEPTSVQPATTTITDMLVEVVRNIERLDLETLVESIESEALAGEGDERRQAAMARADRAELARAFLVLQTTGTAIVRRLDVDAVGGVRDE